MDKDVDAIKHAYLEFVAATAGVMEASQKSDGRQTAATYAARANFKQKLELFRAACDQAEAFVESLVQEALSECLVTQVTSSDVAN